MSDVSYRIFGLASGGSENYWNREQSSVGRAINDVIDLAREAAGYVRMVAARPSDDERRIFNETIRENRAEKAEWRRDFRETGSLVTPTEKLMEMPVEGGSREPSKKNLGKDAAWTQLRYEDRNIHAERGSEAWTAAWDGLRDFIKKHDLGSGDDLAQNLGGNIWEYRGSRVEGRQMVHEFRHRDHPMTGLPYRPEITTTVLDVAKPASEQSYSVSQAARDTARATASAVSAPNSGQMAERQQTATQGRQL